MKNLKQHPKILKRSYEGNRYKFQVIAWLYSKEGVFSLRAIHKKSKQYSSVNNVNGIMPLIEDLNEESYNDNDPELEDSLWESSKENVIRWFKNANKALADVDFYPQLELCLDSDRECGEWEGRLK
jgi:hypothetical protein